MCRYIVANQVVVFSWWRGQSIDEDDYGGTQALMGEGLPPSIGLFVVRASSRLLWHYQQQQIQDGHGHVWSVCSRTFTVTMTGPEWLEPSWRVSRQLFTAVSMGHHLHSVCFNVSLRCSGHNPGFCTQTSYNLFVENMSMSAWTNFSGMYESLN